jgi:cbb3-type cytochrome oxidase maturation protein
MLITISIIVAIFFLYAFIKAVRSGQYDDDYTPSVRILFDDELVKKTAEFKNTKQSIEEKKSKEEKQI